MGKATTFLSRVLMMSSLPGMAQPTSARGAVADIEELLGRPLKLVWLDAATAPPTAAPPR
jgi:hypothetical protein